MTRLVVLDAVPLDQGDVDWDPFRRLGELILHERTAPEDVLGRCRGADIVLTNKVVLGEELFAACPTLSCVQVMATGVNVVNVEAAAEHDVTVLNVPAYSTDSVVQHTWALILELVRSVGAHSDDARSGGWAASNDFSFFRGPLRDLEDMTLGIVGYGTIGQRVAAVAQSFGMKIKVAAIPGRASGEDRVPLDDLLADVDILTIHCPLTELTTNLIDERRLRLMKPNVFLVNTARGAIIDEAALSHVLLDGHLAGVALDVLSVEPPPANHPLLSSPRTIITPHVAWGSVSSRQRLMAMMEKNLSDFLGSHL